MRVPGRLQEIRLHRAALAQQAASERREIGAALAGVAENLAPVDRAAAVLRRVRTGPWSPLLAAALGSIAVRGALRSRRVRIWMLLALARRVFKWLQSRRGASVDEPAADARGKQAEVP